MAVRYVVIPGRIISKNDGQFHYISAGKLMRLYDVDPSECAISYGDERDLGKDFSDLIPLYPLYNGNYKTPSIDEET